MSATVSRRGFFTALGHPFHPTQRRSQSVPALKGGAPGPGDRCESGAPSQDRDGLAGNSASALTAIIQGRFCFALTSFCSVCTERCPVPGAMKKERGLPMVVPDVCTGCGICQEVCPAPRNAVLMMTRRTAPAPVPV